MNKPTLPLSIIVFLLVSITFTPSYADTSGPAARVILDDQTQAVRYISGDLTGETYPLPAGELASRYLDENRGLFGIRDVSVELVISKTHDTILGEFVRFNQRLDGLEVVGGQVVVRVADGRVKTVSNHFVPRISLVTKPTVARDRAVSTAESAVNLTGMASGASLVVLPWEGRAYLAFRIEFPFIKAPEPSKYMVYVDASTGGLIMVENRVMTLPATGTGIGVDGTSKSFDTWLTGGKYYLGNQPIPAATIKTYTANNTLSLPGKVLSDLDNYWEDPAGVDAHFYGNYVFDFYGANFGNFTWYKGSGFQLSGGLVSTVHFDTAYDNAFWDGSQMVYGDGDVIFRPLSGSLDVVAHEITHGVTEAINGLTYCREPGALNESWSDVMGMFASIDYGDDLPYQSAEEIMKIDETPGYEAYYALRRLDDPPFRTDAYAVNDYDPADPLNSWGQPEHTSEQYFAGCWPWTDNGGVHINSGIPNKAAYLITTAIGPEKAKQIYYYAMFYLSASSQFVDARDALEQTAIDLYGAGPELSAVQSAFNAVGIP